MDIGEKIKFFRNEKGFTQEELANKCGLSKNGLWNYENNKRQPNLETLTKIADALEVSLQILLWDDTKFIKDLLASFQAAYHTKKNYFLENHKIINTLVDEQILSEERLNILLDDFNNISIDEIQKILFYIKELDLDIYNKFLNDRDLIKMQILGENIQNQRNENNLSIQDLSLKCALDSSYLERLENGFSDYPPNDMLRKIAETLRITVTDLIGESLSAANLIYTTNKEYYSNLTPFELKDLISPKLNLNIATFEKMTNEEKTKIISGLSKVNPFHFKLQKHIDNFSDFSKEDLIDISNGMLEYGYNLVVNFIDTDFSNLANDYNNLINKYNKLIAEYNALLKSYSVKDDYIELLNKQIEEYKKQLNEAMLIFDKLKSI